MRIALRTLLALSFVALLVGAYLVAPQFFGEVQVQKASVSQESVSIEPLPLTIYCPGPLAEVGGEQGTELGRLELIGNSQIQQYSSRDTLLQNLDSEVAAGGSLEVEGAPQSTELLVANQTQSIFRARGVGLAATNCPQPESSGWFATGVSGSGNESVLFLSNPNQTEAQVNLEFFLPGRILEHRVTLAAGQKEVIALAAFSDAEPNYGIRFFTDGPKVSMALQNRSARGLTATGIELQTPLLDLAQRYLITGLSTYAVGFEAPQLILINPSNLELRVSVKVVGHNSPGVDTIVVLAPGDISSTSLNLPQGSFTVYLESEGQFLSAIRNTTLEPVLDFGWLSPAQKFKGMLTLPVPDLNAILFLANDQNKGVSITIESISRGVSDYRTVLVPANSGLSVPVSGDTLRLQSSGEFYAALELLDTGGYSVIQPRENRNLGDELLVRVR